MAEILFVEYCAKDFLDGTLNMEPLTELAYRRICDMITSTNDKLLDNDSLKYSTKAGGKWKKIRQELIDMEKIYIEDGYIKNKTCTKKLAKSRANIEQKSLAGKASSEKRKSLKNNNTTSTAVATDVPTSEPTNQKPNNQLKEKDKKENILFEDFWNEYPKKTGIGSARTEWGNQIFLKNADPAKMVNAAKNYYSKRLGEDDQFTKSPAKFLAEQVYLDEDLQAEPSKPLDLGELQIWEQSIVNQIGAVQFNQWFKGAKLEGETLIADTKFKADFIREQFSTPCRKVFKHIEITRKETA